MKTDAHWKKIGQRPHHGICLPLSAIRSHKSCGIGEFLDLLPLIDWCQKIGLDCLQLLPLNDTGDDPSPYNPISSCAIDPIYLSLRDLKVPLDDRFQPLNNLPRLRRSEVKQLKLGWLFAFFKEKFSSFQKDPSYSSFLKDASWLFEYAKNRSSQDERGIDFHCFLQYLCFSQLKKVREFAESRSFFLVGDIPHLLSPYSIDVSAHPSFFQRDLAAGAPPDPYNAFGQNWGFPLFHWEAMKDDGYTWWKTRLRTIENFYHIYRLDHVVGFFRIWGIQPGKRAAEGSFYPPNRSLWEERGKEILEMMIDASSLLPIAEDLGTIPSEVYSTLRKLGICGTKVLRWQPGIPLNQYEPLSLTTVSTPDLEPLALFWQKYPEEASSLCQTKGWTYEQALSPNIARNILKDAHHTSSYFHINLLQEYLFLFPDLRWPNLEEERINVPGTVLATNWTYRFRPTLEEIVNHAALQSTILEITCSGC
ncbi:MAG TPA: 4-alpha-glucanotransferase [Chlamydiales bacterium]|nr:4-alpha-glucanotransferase [Chlamydiales bacterium]